MAVKPEAARGYIVVEDWRRFQHYKDRTPLWIKNYTELMSDDAYLALTLHQRGVLHGLWMEYARARRQIPDSTTTVSRRLGERVTRATLDSLNHAGFITYAASAPLAEPAQPASPEVEVEKEKKPPTPFSRTTERRPTSRARTIPSPPCDACGIGGGAHASDCELAEPNAAADDQGVDERGLVLLVATLVKNGAGAQQVGERAERWARERTDDPAEVGRLILRSGELFAAAGASSTGEAA